MFYINVASLKRTFHNSNLFCLDKTLLEMNKTQTIGSLSMSFGPLGFIIFIIITFIARTQRTSHVIIHKRIYIGLKRPKNSETLLYGNRLKTKEQALLSTRWPR